MKNKKKPTCTGAGLLALDVILNDDDLHNPSIYAGGSMGNVLTILSYLGWDSYPIARLASDYAADEITEDLDKWSVKQHLITKTEDGSTPVIIQRNYIDKSGNPRHRFQFKCPLKKEWFPGYKSIIRKSLQKIQDQQSNTVVFYFDRVSRGNVDLAKFYYENGAFVYFEPAGVSNTKHFIEAIQNSHIIKFSNDRITNYDDYHSESKALLTIRTLGIKGIEYISKIHGVNCWKLVPGFKIHHIRDTSGAGDWFSATLINFLGVNPIKNLLRTSHHDLMHYLKYSQAFAGINCQFYGARGVMYGLKLEEMKFYVEELLHTGEAKKIEFSNKNKEIPSYPELVDLLIKVK